VLQKVVFSLLRREGPFLNKAKGGDESALYVGRVGMDTFQAFDLMKTSFLNQRFKKGRIHINPAIILTRFLDLIFFRSAV